MRQLEKLEKFQENSAFEVSSLPGKLVDRQSKSPENSELFIVEGDSKEVYKTG